MTPREAQIIIKKVKEESDTREWHGSITVHRLTQIILEQVKYSEGGKK